MTTFEYLAVLFSVVVGLALAQTLQGLLRLVQYRESVSVSWPALIWTAAVLQWAVFFWWFSGLNLAQAEEWHFSGLLFVLAYGAVLFFLLGLLYPNELGQGFDMRAHFDHNRPWFFGAFLGLGLLDVVDTWFKLANGLSSLSGRRLVEYIAFLAIWLVSGATAIRVKHAGFVGLAGLLFIVMTYYIAMQTPVMGVMLLGP